MDKILDKTCEALEEIERADNWNIMNGTDRKTITELVKLKKDIMKAQKLEMEMEDGYSMDGDWRADMRGTYRNGSYGNGSYSGKNDEYGYSGRRHRVRGHYSNNDYSGRRDSMGRYSRTGDTVAELRELMENADSDREREAIRRCMEEMRG